MKSTQLLVAAVAICLWQFAPRAMAQGTGPSCVAWSTLRGQLLNNIPVSNKVVTAQHRGDFDAATPENSLGAFQNSYRYCRPGVETDVRATSDGKLVVFHDLNIEKMLEPSYDPYNNTGPNALLSSLTLVDLKKKFLVTPARKATAYKVPTVEEMLRNYVDSNGQSIIYLETKTASVIQPTVRALYDLSQSDPKYNSLLQRVVLKISMAEYPTPDRWNTDVTKTLGKGDIVIMADPVISPGDAQKINSMADYSCPAGSRYSSKAVCAVNAWASATSSLAPMVSVVIKDTSEFTQKIKKISKQGEYDSPTSLQIADTVDGSMARMLAVIKQNRKALEIFVPVPDYILWRMNSFYLATEQVFDPDAQRVTKTINVHKAFFNNNSSCCYELVDKLQKTAAAAENSDYRMNLAWINDLGANVITADDTDSINVYFSKAARLDMASTPKPSMPKYEMASVLSWQLGYSYLKANLLANDGKSWEGTFAGGIPCLWSNPNSYAWTFFCGADALSYSKVMWVVTLPDGRMRVFDGSTGSRQCLIAGTGSPTATVNWGSACDSRQSAWNISPGTLADANVWKDRAMKDPDGRLLSYFRSGQLYFGYWYGTAYVYPQPASVTSDYLWQWNVTGYPSSDIVF